VSRGFAPPHMRVYQTLYRARRMVIGELEWALGQELSAGERKLFQGMHAAALAEGDALRGYLESEGALSTMTARSGRGPSNTAWRQSTG
jgi:hypothetical protein